MGKHVYIVQRGKKHVTASDILHLRKNFVAVKNTMKAAKAVAKKAKNHKIIRKNRDDLLRQLARR